MANWQRGSLFLKGTKDKLANVLFSVMREEVSMHGFDLPGVPGAYVGSDMKINFGDSAKVDGDSYIYKTCLSNRGGVEVDDYVRFANTWGVDVYVNVADPWAGIELELLIQNGVVSKCEVEEIER